MKKLFLIALFAIGLTTTLSAQSVTIDASGTPIAYLSGHNEPMNLAWTIPGYSRMYELQLSGGGSTYRFIVELDPSDNILWLEIWEI